MPTCEIRAVLEDGDAVAEAERLVEVVGDEDDGLLEPALQLHELVLHLAPDQRVERREGLVHEQDLGVGAERAGEADALLHAAGELRRVAVLVAGKADRRRPIRAARSRRLRLRHALDLEAVGDVVDDGAVREQAEALEDHRRLAAAEPLQLADRQAEHVDAVDRRSRPRSGRSAG